MAHKLAAGSTKNNRDSNPKYLGVKIFGGQAVGNGNIILRQRGTKFHPGTGVKRVSDDSLVAKTSGVVQFVKKKVVAFNGNLVKRTFVNVVPAA